MSNQHAKPGDTVEITKNNEFLGRKFLVVECPSDRKDGPYANCPWVEYNGDSCALNDRESYRITQHAEEHKPAINSSVDESLERQRDDNLRNVFG